MFSSGKHLVNGGLASRVQRLALAANNSARHRRTLCCCYGNSCHGSSTFHPVSQSHLGVKKRNVVLTHLREPDLNQRTVGQICRTVSLRSLSSKSDSSETETSDHTDLTEGDAIDFEEVVKELDAEGTGPRKSSKRKTSSGSSKETLVSVGRLVPDKIVNLLDEDGESLGSLHRMDAIKRSQQAGLKLVLINPNSQPYPTYRLMTGQQLHQEHMILQEKRKAKSAPLQVKEVRLSGNIAQHDLDVKRKHVHEWFKEGGSHFHVRLVVMGSKKRGQKPVTKEQQMAVIHHVMSGLEDRVTFMSKPRDTGKDGANVMVVLRPMSAKEKASLVKQKNKEESLKVEGQSSPEDR